MKRAFAFALILALLLCGCAKRQIAAPQADGAAEPTMAVEPKPGETPSLPPLTEDAVLEDYREAEEMWSWFDRTTMPLDPERPASEEWYYAVDYPGVTTMAQLRALLLTRFSDEIAEELLAQEGDLAHYKEIDGVLCAVQADRGSDITVASVDCVVEPNGDNTAGKVVATVHRQDFDEAKEEWVPAGDDTVEFPFDWTENGARFTFFESVW